MLDRNKIIHSGLSKKMSPSNLLFKKIGWFQTEFVRTKGKMRAFIRHPFGLLPSNKVIILDPKSSKIWRRIALGRALNNLDLKFYNCFVNKLIEKKLRSFIPGMRTQNIISNKKIFILAEGLKKEFLIKKVRPAQYAGIFYEKNPDALRRSIHRHFELAKISRVNMRDRNERNICGIIVPHSNIEISGTCAAYAYKVLGHHPLPDLFVLLGPDHSGIAHFPYLVFSKDFETPLGIVKTDKDFCLALQKNCNFNIFADSFAHANEHSLELQLPFLQYLYAPQSKKLIIVPILCSGANTAKAKHEDFIKALKKTVIQSKKKVVFISTGDLSHCAWIRRQKEEFFKKNKKIIKLLEDAEPKKFMETLKHPDYKTVCGKYPFYTLLCLITPAKGKKLNYTWRSKRLALLKKKTHNLSASQQEVGHVSMVFAKE